MIVPERATSYAVLNRLWGSAGGLLTAALVATFFTPTLQGYYYGFLSLLTFQTMVELGFGEMLQQFVSHEWAREAHDERARSRLSSLLRFSVAWYAGIALLLFGVLGLAGSLYFRSFAREDGISWELAWWLAALATSLGVLLTPFFSFLEGGSQVRKVYGVRLSQGVLSRLAGFAAIVGGLGLFTIPIVRAVSFLNGALGFGRDGIALVRRFWSAPRVESFSFRRELWPLQSRFALSWLSGYVFHSFLTPVLFALEGPVVAGQMGMTLMAMGAISSAAFAVVTTKVPRLALHAAERRYGAMDALFRHATFSALAVCSAGGALFFGALAAARALELEIAHRFLPLLPTALLLAAAVLQQARFSMGSYLRAHKEEPFVAIAVAETLVGVPVLVLLGRSFGALGMALGFLALTAGALLPAFSIFARCRALWHAPGMERDARPV